jgi:hypothetical protein
MIHRKNVKSKISLRCPFKPEIGNVRFPSRPCFRDKERINVEERNRDVVIKLLNISQKTRRDIVALACTEYCTPAVTHKQE